MHSPNQPSNRIFEYDLIRTVAILAVIMIHCSAEYVIKFPSGSSQFRAGNCLNAASRLAIPCFIMLSGRFLLDENRIEAPIKIAKKFLKLFFILLNWSLFYALWFRPESFISAIFYGHYHLWYLFIAIGLYLVTPVLRLFVNGKNKTYIYYFLTLAIFFNYTPPLLDVMFRVQTQSPFTRYADAFSINLVCGYLPLYISGWLINQDFERIKKHKIAIYATMIISLMIVIWGAEFYASPTFQAYHFFYNQSNLPVFAYGISAFISLKIFAQKISEKLSLKVKNAIIMLSKLSLGIYLVHIAILLKVIDLVRYLYGLTYENCAPLIYIPLIYIPTLVLSIIVTYAISKTKYLNKFIKI